VTAVAVMSLDARIDLGRDVKDFHFGTNWVIFLWNMAEFCAHSVRFLGETTLRPGDASTGTPLRRRRDRVELKNDEVRNWSAVLLFE
jgi:hypothetical protein